MRNMPFIAALVAGLALSAGAQPMMLTTTFASNNGCQGNMFDVVALNPVTIRSFDVNVAPGTHTIEVYALNASGTYVGSETNPGAWTLIASTSVTSAGTNMPTPLNLSLCLTLATSQRQAFYVTGTGASNPINYTNGTAVGTLFASDANLQFFEGAGFCSPQFSSPINTRVFNGNIHYNTSSTCIAEYQTNQTNASVTLNGVQGAGNSAATTLVCPGAPVTLDIQSPLTGNLFDAAVTLSPLLPASGGGIVTPNSQVVNIDILHPSMFFLNSGTPAPAFFPFPGNLNLMFNAPPAGLASIQFVILDPANPDGFTLSQGATLEVATPQPVSGPTGDDSSLTINLTTPPLCGSAITFYGTTYTQMHVISNGRIMFVNGDTDFSPSVAEALTDNPFVGPWVDLSPNVAGTISTAVTAPGVITTTWSNVPYYGNSGLTASFSISFDTSNDSITISGLNSFPVFPVTVGAENNMFLGLSAGNTGSTDVGQTTFSIGGPNPPPAGLGMIYQFGQGGTLAPGVNTITFTPSGGNYTWTGS